MESSKEVDEAVEEYKKRQIDIQIEAFNEGYRLGCRAAKQINN